jgi:RNA polymerase sigma factor (TIGR02999 family)
MIARVSDVTRILERTGDARSNASEELLPLVYEELRQLAAAQMAREAPGHTLQPTALVHEAWLRLSNTPGQTWNNRAHFFRTAAECIRRILIDHARQRQRIRHGGGQQKLSLDECDIAQPRSPDVVLEVDEALERLTKLDRTKAEIVKLRFFGGLENREIAEVLGISERTVERGWRFARAWLLALIDQKN